MDRQADRYKQQTDRQVGRKREGGRAGGRKRTREQGRERKTRKTNSQKIKFYESNLGIVFVLGFHFLYKVHVHFDSHFQDTIRNGQELFIYDRSSGVYDFKVISLIYSYTCVWKTQ